MPLLGKGAMVAMYDVVAGDERKHDHWHAHEHVLERVGIQGFLRGRRYVSDVASPRYFIIYEVESLDTQVSAPYLERLNNPTPWTRRAMPSMTGMIRTLTGVTGSVGTSVGGCVAVIRLSPPAGAAELRGWVVEALPRLAGTEGVLAAHLLEGDQGLSRTPTEEKAIRDQPDQIADWILVVEGYDAGLLAALTEDEIIPALREHRVAGLVAGQYQLSQLLDATSIAAAGGA